MRLGILCPGQGSQHPGMLDRIRNEPLATSILLQVADLQADDPFQNACAQPLVCATTLAIWAILKDRLPPPSLIAGYSVGELTAYGVAGVLPPEQVINLARIRATAMDQACPAPNGLVAVRGLDRAAVTRLCTATHTDLAIVTGFDRHIVGGTTQNLQNLTKSAESLGAHITHLPITIASHTPLMSPARDVFGAALAAAEMHQPHVPVLSGLTASSIRTPEAARQTLIDQLDHTIEWEKVLSTVPELGCDAVLELGPGNALSRMAEEHGIKARSVWDFSSWDGIVAWVNT